MHTNTSNTSFHLEFSLISHSTSFIHFTLYSKHIANTSNVKHSLVKRFLPICTNVYGIYGILYNTLLTLMHEHCKFRFFMNYNTFNIWYYFYRINFSPGHFPSNIFHAKNFHVFIYFSRIYKIFQKWIIKSRLKILFVNM